MITIELMDEDADVLEYMLLELIAGFNEADKFHKALTTYHHLSDDDTKLDELVELSGDVGIFDFDDASLELLHDKVYRAINY